MSAERYVSMNLIRRAEPSRAPGYLDAVMAVSRPTKDPNLRLISVEDFRRVAAQFGGVDSAGAVVDRSVRNHIARQERTCDGCGG